MHYLYRSVSDSISVQKFRTVTMPGIVIGKSSWNMFMYYFHLHGIMNGFTSVLHHNATDASLTADPGVASSILARSHTFVEIDHEIISTAILLPSAESFKKGCCQLQAKLCARSTG